MIWPHATDYNAAVQNPQLCFGDDELRQGQVVGDLFGLPRPRYQAISEHLRQTQRAFMVEFDFFDEGIRIGGQWYPLVKMRWVEGFRLNEFIREQLDKPALLERLSQMW